MKVSVHLLNHPVDCPSGIDTGVPEGTSTGLSRYLLDTYGDDNDESREFAEDPRPPRYGAFVFGDRIPVNVTIDWDEVRDRPELFGLAFEVAGEVLPADGGTYDLKVLQSLLEMSWEYGMSYYV